MPETEVTYFDVLEQRSADERGASHDEALVDLLRHAVDKRPSWRATLSTSYEDVRSVDDLPKLPVRRKSELIELQQQQPPLGGLNATDVSALSHIFASPGPIYEPDVEGGDYWRFGRAFHAAGIRRGDIIHNTFSYHLTPAGFMVESGARAVGCPVIAAGTGQTELQLQAIRHIKPSAYVGTPSYLRILLEKAAETGEAISFRKALVSGEAFPPALAKQFAENHGINGFQCYATADLGLIAYETSARDGLIIDEHVVVEIVRPGTGDPVAEGEVGEVLVTSFNRDYPMIRFATGDLSMLLPAGSACGRTNQRLKGWMGRADQTTKIRGMFVQPAQVDRILRQIDAKRGRLVVMHDDQTRDVMTLHIETERPDNTKADAQVIDVVRSVTGMRAAIEWVAAGSLPNDGKVIDDQRPLPV